MNLVLPVLGNVAVASEMQDLLAFMDRIRDLPAEEQLDEIRRWINETIRGARDGWF
jgi:hypothetical protein